MSGDECDDLPSISVNSGRNSNQFVMPSAEELASQRAREEECERKLLQLREEKSVAAVTHSDSSGSEGETALAAAVTALRVNAESTPSVRTVVQLVSALFPHVPPATRAFLQDYINALPIESTDTQTVEVFTDNMLCELCAVLSGREVCDEAEVIGTGVWLCAVAVSEESRMRRATARRTLHHLLDHLSTPEHVLALARVLSAGIADARLLLDMSDAARSGRGVGGDRLAAMLVATALRILLRNEPTDDQMKCSPLTNEELSSLLSERWRGLGPRAQYTTVQLVGRALSTEQVTPCGDILQQMAALVQPARHIERHGPDHLKVVVAASTLQLLFRGRV